MYFNPHSWKAIQYNGKKNCDLCSRVLVKNVFICRICGASVHPLCAFKHKYCNHLIETVNDLESLTLNINTDLGNWYNGQAIEILEETSRGNSIINKIHELLVNFKQQCYFINSNIDKISNIVARQLIFSNFYQILFTEFESKSEKNKLFFDKINLSKVNIENIEIIKAKKIPEDKLKIIHKLLITNNCKCGDSVLETMIQTIIQTKDKINWWAEHLYIKEFYVSDSEYSSLEYCNCVLESALNYLLSNDSI